MKAPASIHHLGVVGGGTMGSGIALVGLMANLRVSLVEPVDGVRHRARDYLHRHLEKKGLGDRLRSLTLVADLESLHGAHVVIEAVPEDLRLKHQIFRDLDLLCAAPAVLATNTSTLSVSAIAAAASCPERVAGMHFFNPAPVLSLVEIIRGDRTDPSTLDRLLSFARQLGKTAVVARDTPGFIVNRVARPYYGEALKLLGEAAAPVEVIDRVLRGAGFPLGPFQLMDLIGLDVNFAATKAMYDQTFGEPRYRPHAIQKRMVEEGHVGRKAGRGFYVYTEGERAAASEPVAAPAEPPMSVATSAGSWAPGLSSLLSAAGLAMAEPGEADLGIVTAGGREANLDLAVEFDRRLPASAPLLVQCADVAFSEIASAVSGRRRLVGFDGLLLEAGKSATVVASPELLPAVRQSVEHFFFCIGRPPAWVEESPGMILPRVIALLANEAAFACAEGVADADTIDLAMRLGTNYPHGPLEWGRALGWGRILSVLDHLRQEFGEDRYRAAPIVRRWAREESAV